MIVATDSLKQIRDLYDRGLYLQAYEASQAHGPLSQWRGTDARILAGRLASNLGAVRMGRVLHRLARRADPQHAEAQYYYLFALLARRGPWEAWQFASPIDDLPSADDELRAAWQMLKAYILALFRDFSEADRHFRRALDIAPDSAWVWVQWSDILEMEDRHDESLETALKALQLRPWYRPAVQVAGHSLIQSNRVEDALEMLGEAVQHLESGDVLAQLATLQTELEMYDDARRNWQQVQKYYPLIDHEKERKKWLHARLADAAYYCGDFEAAIKSAEESGEPFHLGIAERLRNMPRDQRRVMLPVGFVRQHHLTCSPATLSAICEYHDLPANHLDVVEQICYDGTPASNERTWAEDQGLLVREFRVTWETAVGLIDAGLPFTLTTVDPGNAHLQAVIGYDPLRGTLLVRDPSQRLHGEFRAEETVEHYQATGPRGMLLAPQEKAEAIAGLEFCEASQYDDYYKVERALSEHRRDEAETIVQQMRARAPGERLTYYGGRATASYDADPIKMLENINGLLEKYPDDINLRLAKLASLQEVGRREDRMDLLKSYCEPSDADPLFLIEYARELCEDSRESPRVEWLLRRVLRRRPTHSAVYDLLAGIRWTQMQRDEASQLYRFAACLDDKHEGYAQAYFTASRHLKQTEDVLNFMRERQQRYGRQSSLPAQTLCWAYDQLEQPNRAFDVLQEALDARPDDGDLKLYAAGFYSRYGRNEEAETLLEQAQEKTSRTTWLRTAASLAANRSDLQQALERWQGVLELEPLASDANRMVPELLASLQDDEAAIDHVKAMVQRFPHSYALRCLRIEWSGREPPEVAEHCIGDLLQTHPKDAWARRELAICLLKQSRLEEAMAEADLAEQLEPSSPVVHLIKGRIYEGRGKLDPAKEHFQNALRLSVDYDPAIESLMQICDTKQDRVDGLEFIAAEMVRQTVFGDSLSIFRLYAEGTMEPERLLEILREARQERPDLWQSWMVLIQQLVSLQDFDEAHAVAKEAVQRFPLLPRLWLELAQVCRDRKEPEEEISAIRQALDISPGWGEAERLLAAAHQRQGDLDAAQAAIERAIRFDPRDCQNHSLLAELLWERKDRDAALSAIQRSVILEPGHEVAWNLLRQWAGEMQKPTLAIDAARELTQARPNEARSWLVLADTLEDAEQPGEYLAALDEAIRCYPRSVDAYSKKAFCLAQQRKFPQALENCHPSVFGDRVPVQLRARQAQITSLRGNLTQAIEQMREVVADDPDYAWAWSQLGDWYEASGEVEHYLEASENLVRIAPHTAATHGYYGDALIQSDRREEGMRALETSIALSPDYFYGARYLLELYLEDRLADAARHVYERTHDYMPAGYAEAYRVRLAAAEGKQAEALADLRRLRPPAGSDMDPFTTALRNIDDFLPAREVANAIQPDASDQDVHPDVSYVWAQMSVRGGLQRDVRNLLKKMPSDSAHWASAAGAYIHETVEVGRTQDVLKFIHKQRKALRQHDLTWRLAGEALSDLDQRASAVKWLADWEDREDVTVRVLFCLSLSLRVLAREREAHEVNLHALQLPPDTVTPYHELWLASDAAMDADGDEAIYYLNEVEGVQWNDYYRTLLDMTWAVTQGLQQSEQAGAYKIAARELKQVRRSGDKLLDRTYIRYRASLARHYNKKLRAALFRVRSWLT